MESFAVADSLNEEEIGFGGEENYKIYTKKHFGVITLSKYKEIDWLNSLEEKYAP